VEQVTQFKYLGSIASSYGYCEKGMCNRIAMAKQAFMNRKTAANWKTGYTTVEKNNKLYSVKHCSLWC